MKPTPYFSKKSLIIGAFCLLIITASIIYLHSSKNTKSTSDINQASTINAQQNIEDNIVIQPPFYELTIPYLSNRDYSSFLYELDQQNSNSYYTSHLTAYDSDGLKINALLTIPQSEMPEAGWPAIIFIHGYIPPANYQTTENYSSYVDYLARNEFVVFKIDLRGHGNSEGTPSGAYYSSDYIIDTLNAKSALGNSNFVDENRIGLWGHSMAGNVALRSATAGKDIPAISIWAGAVYTYKDFADYGISDGSYRPPSDSSPTRTTRNELFETHGRFNPESEFWQQVPATNYMDEFQTSVQLNHAINDNVVTIEYSRNLSRILDQYNIPHELNEYDGGGHNISGATFTQAMQNTVRFFKENL